MDKEEMRALERATEREEREGVFAEEKGDV